MNVFSESAKIVASLALIGLTFSCVRSNSSNTSKNTSKSESASDSIQDFCFLRTEGNSNQDTTTLHLKIIGNQVTGRMEHIPFEKDSRKGTIEGLKTGNLISGIWTFMQEGITDTLAVELKLNDSTVLQKAYVTDQSTGRQKLSDASEFSIRFEKTACQD